MRHFLNDSFQGHPSLMIKFQHSDKAMLHQGPARWSLKIQIVFFGHGMGGVVCGDNINPVVELRMKDRLLVTGFLDSRVPFNQGPHSIVVTIIEHQVVNTCFCSYLLFLKGDILKEAGFPGGGYMEDVKPCAVLSGERNGK